MPSARYTLNIKPEDLQPDVPRELTKKKSLPTGGTTTGNGWRLR